LLELVRLARLTLGNLPYREIMTVCTSREGERLARAVGLSLIGTCDNGKVYHGQPDELRRGRACKKTGRAATHSLPC
jgi:hypothetical protein